MKETKINKFWFYFLSFTWGILLTLIGCIVSIVLIISGKKPKKYGYCWYFELGHHWGGLELGPCFLKQQGEDTEYLSIHEFGHGVQNCIYGPLMPFIVCIPSVIRYWYRHFRDSMGIGNETGYYSIWFEKQANKFGEKNIEK